MASKILVTGVSGQQGGAVARAFIAKGQPFRGLSRSSNKLDRMQGAELVQGDLTDRKSLEKALHGIESAFLVTTWLEDGCEAEIGHGKTFIDAAKQAGIKHIVYTSVAAADEQTGIPHFMSKFHIEEHLCRSGVAWTILRPVWFMENFGAPWFLSIQGGKVVVPVHRDTQVSMVSLETIGQFGAAALLNPEQFDCKALTLVSDSLTFPHAFELLGKAIGRQIGYQELPEEQAEGVYGPDLAKMFRWFNERGFTDTTAELKPYGLALPSFEEHLKTARWLDKLKQTIGVE